MKKLILGLGILLAGVFGIIGSMACFIGTVYLNIVYSYSSLVDMASVSMLSFVAVAVVGIVLAIIGAFSRDKKENK